MMRSLCMSLASLLAFAGSVSAAAPPPSDAAIYGTWRNPKGTIEVRTAPCQGGLCGEIVRASPKAVDDARKKGVDTLVGLQLLKDYHRREKDWAGHVYVPDMGRTFSSRIVMIDDRNIRISGCLVGGFLCKSQVWTRV
ncbi:MAG: DUF2147 domain-containing protein [Sphingomonas sp.]